MNRTNIVIAASTIALIALIAFQVKWMIDSRNLIEQQFNQKVTMAMSYAVDLLGEEQFIASCSVNSEACTPLKVNTETCAPTPAPLPQLGSSFQLQAKSGIDEVSTRKALDIAMDKYDIETAYKVAVVNPQKTKLDFIVPKYSCNINPLEESKSNLLTVSFPNKEAYVFGKMKFMLISSVVLLSFITLVFLFSNYTMLRQKRMQRINKEFFNNMAHEFRTPLANISLANNLIAKTNDETKKSKYTKVVKDESHKLAQQVDRILHLAKMENGEYQLEKESLCLKELIQTVVKDLDLQIKEKHAVVNITFADDLNTIEGDKFHLGNAFRNLLENALKYSDDAPKINVSLENSKAGTIIRFEDNGIGISKQDQKEIFDKFFRVNHGNVHNQKGFGLGLAYVKMIIELHKGVVKLFSDLNKGTRFDLFIPTS